jgi:eukaryotic-like serine/threonine-protein kinase
MNPQVTLTILSGSLKDTRKTFDSPNIYSLGRDDRRDIAFPDNSEHSNVSRHHCDLQIVTLDPPQILLTDRQSTHGTFHNGKKISQATALSDRDIFSLGDIAIQIQFIGITPQQSPDLPTFMPPIPAIPKPLVRAGRAIAPKFVAAIKNFLEISPPPVVTPPSPENPDPAAPLQFQDYELGELLGQGAFSEVYRAMHKESGRQVALKILQPEIAKQDAAVQQFIREIDNTKVLDHPNVARLLDFRYHQGAFFYTTEYCEAGSLLGLMEQLGGKLPLDWAKLAIDQILTGLAYTHQVEVPSVPLPNGGFGKGRGLIHRSLKPENILLTNLEDQLIIKISDFALSKAFGSAGLTQSPGSFAGTPYYMPRSQLLNYQTVQPAGDLWAAMACFYEMITGYPPREFGEGEDPIEVILQKAAIPILERAPYLSPTLAAVVDRALQENPDHSTHYQTASALQQDLHNVW